MAKLKMLLEQATHSIRFVTLTANNSINVVDTNASYGVTLSGNTVNISNASLSSDFYVTLEGDFTSIKFDNSDAKINGIKELSLIGNHSITNMEKIFNGCGKLIKIHELDTSNVINMSSMFRNCSSLTTIPQLNTSKATNMEKMFYGCGKLISVPQLDTSNVTDMMGIFMYCSTLTTIPQLDTSNVTSMYDMFYGCKSLINIPLIDVSKSKGLLNTFYNCKSLQSVKIKGLTTDLDLLKSPLLDIESVNYLLNNLEIKKYNSGGVIRLNIESPGFLNLKYDSTEYQNALNKGYTFYPKLTSTDPFKVTYVDSLKKI